jgi:hypothetical protein
MAIPMARRATGMWTLPALLLADVVALVGGEEVLEAADRLELRMPVLVGDMVSVPLLKSVKFMTFYGIGHSINTHLHSTKT